MSIVSTLRILASQRPSTPPRAVADPSRVTRGRPGHVPVTWIDQELAATATIVHLHGGAYVAGEQKAHWSWLEEVGRRAGAATAMVHYRLAPKHPFPTAVEDVLAALDGMGEASLLRPGRWVLSGDSAGGGLALAVAQSLAQGHADSPALLMLESPWTDLPARRDGEDELRRAAARLYAGGVPSQDPRLSPIHGDLSSLPPVHLVVGGEDELLTDSRRLHAGLLEAGTDVQYVEIPGQGHTVAVTGEGPDAQAARRTQIEAARRVLTLRAAS